MLTSFVLVHGGQQGAWAYDLLIPELERHGHHAIAVELPAGDLDAGANAYAAVVTEAVDACPGEVVLVGHSLGGLTIPLVATRRRVERLVFVCAAYPEPGRSHLQARAEEPGESVAGGASAAWQQPGDSHMLPPEVARELFFGDCPRDLQDWAIARMRPQARRPLREITPLLAWPDTPRTLIITTDDRCIPRDSARATAMRLFHAEPIELPGGHCPSLSRPGALAEVLLDSLR